jgi:hypothetical protein
MFLPQLANESGEGGPQDPSSFVLQSPDGQRQQPMVAKRVTKKQMPLIAKMFEEKFGPGGYEFLDGTQVAEQYLKQRNNPNALPSASGAQPSPPPAAGLGGAAG